MSFSFPASPTIGQSFTPIAGTTYTWNGNGWLLGGSLFTISDTAPANPLPGALWWDSSASILWFYYQDVDSSQWVSVSGPGPQGAPGAAGVGTAGPIGPTGGGAGRLNYSSATQLLFSPYNGDRIRIGGTVYPIPSAGVVCASTNVNVNGTTGQSLVANTTYLVGLYDSGGGTLAPIYVSGSTHAPSTTAGNVGTEIIGSNEAVSLIGMCRTNASSQFDSFLTMSWFNRRSRSRQSHFQGNRSTTSTTAVEINSEVQIPFLCWADEVAYATIDGSVSHSAANAVIITLLGLDGSAQVLGSYTMVPATSWYASFSIRRALGGISSGGMIALAEGFHTASIFGNVQAGTGSWIGGADPSSTGTTLLTVEVRG